ncbi:M48 family metallopeptidase [Pseudorhodoferax sp.]|uniref:M48 family metallopeptidase n=1 Tax=Pseudorhodoferax sp. TaxID=1993553 RepID=UPI002DD6650B|nr:M48 family metallopeptidase [Pseudorhodoferax sp.]
MIYARYFDGRSARAHAVRLHIEGHTLVMAGEADARWPLAAVRWPERTRHGKPVLHLADGASLEITDATALAAWRRRHGLHEPWVVRLQQSWRLVAVAALLLVCTLVLGYRYGIPAAARGVVALLPTDVDQAVGRVAMDTLAAQWLKPSRLPVERQQALRRRLAEAAASFPGGAPPFELHFHAGPLGPNALALPGGTIVITDAMVEMLADREDTLIGVFGHELSHLHHRHGLQALVQIGLLAAAGSAALGDFSGWLAGVPALLGQLAYSRAAERQADADAARLMRAHGLTPAAMIVMFERLATHPLAAGPRLPLALASHPADAERMAYFRSPQAGH